MNIEMIKYVSLIKQLESVGIDSENVLSYHSSNDTWSIEAVNKSFNVAIGDTGGEIISFASTLKQVVDSFEIKVVVYIKENT